MRRMLPLLAVLAVSLAAVGGVAAADGAIQTESTPNETSGDGPDMGICVVGADSPCNDESTDGDETAPTHPTPQNDSERIDDGDADDDSQIRIPEDQNRDGEIDERFKGDAPADAGETEETHIGSDDGEDRQVWIPEDQNHDGEIDDRFGGGGLTGLLFDALFAF